MPMIQLRSGKTWKVGRLQRATTTIQRKFRARKSATTAKAVRAIAKSVVRKEAEDKFISANGAVLFNSRISASSECYPLIPQITQGTGDYQRIGDKVRGKYMYVKGYVQVDHEYLGQLSGAQYIAPFTGRCMILSQKNIKVGSEVASRADVNHLLKDNVGTGTARGYTSTVLDNLAPINKDLFKVHMDRKFKFSWVSKFENEPSTNNSIGVGQERTKYFTCRIKLPATMTFDDGNGDWVNNFAPFLCFGAVNDDGQSPWLVGTPYRVGWLSTVYFEDS